MKNLSDLSLHNLKAQRAWALAVLAVSLASVALWAQSKQPSFDEQVAREFARMSLMDPVALNAALDKVKTPEDRAAEVRARLAITDPAGYAALYGPKDPASLEAQAKAIHEFTHPFEATASVEQRKRDDAAYREAEAEALRAIRQPAGSVQN